MPRTLTETRPTVNQNVPNRIDGIAVLPDRAVRDPSQIVGFRVNVDPSDPGQRRSYRDRLGSIVGVGSDGTASIRVNPQHESSAALLYDIQHNLGSTFSLHLDPPRRMADLIVGDSPAQPSCALWSRPTSKSASAATSIPTRTNGDDC